MRGDGGGEREIFERGERGCAEVCLVVDLLTGLGFSLQFVFMWCNWAS